MFERRYDRNGSTVTGEEQKILRGKRVLIAGCGGLGGYIIEMLTRVGVGHITAVDPDVFDETNLNRQLLSSEELIGVSKAEAAAERVRAINSEAEITPIAARIDGSNAAEISRNHDLVIDAMDNPAGRIALQKGASLNNIPLVHGAISGWFGQVSVILPGSDLFSTLYPEGEKTAIDSSMGSPSFTPAIVAGFEVAEALKLLLGKGKVLDGELLYIDLLTSRFELVTL